MEREKGKKMGGEREERLRKKGGEGKKERGEGERKK